MLQLVEVEPREVQFEFVEQQPLVAKIRLTNLSKSQVLFKVRKRGEQAGARAYCW